MIYSPHASIFDSDAYGVNTDRISAYDILDDAINRECEKAIREGFADWMKDTANEYFDTWDWDDDFWDSWKEKIIEIV